MKDNVKFYKCEMCGNLIGLISGESDRILCCGQNMTKLIPNTSDGASEKHIPVVERVEDEIIVRVGSVEHPMIKEHYIMWVALVSENKTIRVSLYPEQETLTRFPYIKGATIFAYCNKHGLWQTTVE